MSTFGFDLVEGIRTRSRVPSFGDPRKALWESPEPIAQHPRYLGYWYDSSRHSLVGMHLGLDVIHHGGRYHFLELNLDAATRAERRRLYDSTFDPVVSGILGAAKSWGFRRVVALARVWSNEYVVEFERAGREAGIEVLSCDDPFASRRPRHPLVGLPNPLPEDTMVVVFSSRHTPLDFFVCDKWSSARWLKQELDREPHSLLSLVPSHERLTVPPLPEDPRWPNLVAKLADWDQGRFVCLAKVRDETEAREALGLQDPDGTPRAFRIGLGTRLVNLLTRRGRVMYQPYVPPPLDREQRGVKHRVHMLVTPTGCEFLSAHIGRGARPIPHSLPFGLVADRASYALSYSGGGGYQRVDETAEAELAQVTGHLGRLLDRAIRRRFRTSP